MARCFVVACAIVAAVVVAAAPPVHTTYHWHMQQPIYWPDSIPSTPRTYQKAWDSMQLRPSQNGHPEDDIATIFGKPDRVGDYQSSMTDALNQCLDVPDAGAQTSFSGCLIENVNSLAGHMSGYASGWNDTYAHFAASQKTSAGKPRLDMVRFAYHHALAPLVDRSALRMMLRIDRIVKEKTWGAAGTALSRGFFPAETVFSERVIPALVEEGVEWSFVANNHFSRACKDYPFSPSGDNNNPPNRADQVNPAQSRYWNRSISRGVTPNNAVPFSFTPHWVQYTDPDTAKVSRIVAVPTAQAMGWIDSTGCYGTQDIAQIADAGDAAHPMLVVLAHDGDNAFSGGYSYYHQCVSQFVHSTSTPIHPTTVETYLAQFPPDDTDVVHVEDGAWVNKDGDFGSPQVIGWRWPLLDLQNNSRVNVPKGWGCDQRSYAIITAGQNYVSTAEQVVGPADPKQVQAPTDAATEAEVAWHFFLPSMTSGYDYYGCIRDMPLKATVAVNNAIAHASKAIAGAADSTPPSIWTPQRYPYNPGGYGAGVLHQWRMEPMPVNFYVWTFIHDVSGVSSATLFVRTDADGAVTAENHLRDPARHGLAAAPWTALKMTQRPFPAGDEGGFKFPILPVEIADEFFAEVSPQNNTLIDYYISATDTRGNTAQTDIFHVWVGA